jgi:hypothetical protein
MFFAVKWHCNQGEKEQDKQTHKRASPPGLAVGGRIDYIV